MARAPRTVQMGLSLLLLAWFLVDSTMSVPLLQPHPETEGRLGASNKKETPNRYDPKPDPHAVVNAGSARFTVLTSRLLRLEHSPQKAFVDAATVTFLHRHLHVPPFHVQRNDTHVVLTTDDLVLTYNFVADVFDSVGLSVVLHLNGEAVTWVPGTSEQGNLLGTIRTLDGANGSVPLPPGLLSRDGWALVNDTLSPLLDDNPDWPWAVARPPSESHDLYFFGYGHDYRAALRDFTLVAGPLPLPPRFAFGIWYSRYWFYDDEELKAVVLEYERHDLPLSVLVVDMDWHITDYPGMKSGKKDQAGQPVTWTGYTWNRHLFPNPQEFLEWCKSHHLRNTLNLHPASGVQPHEEQYAAMAQAMGIDPHTKKYVPFNITDRKYVDNLFKIVLGPLEDEGIDFWWLDWQQWDTTDIPNLNPTFWLNYVFWGHMERKSATRPMIFHRFGGLGNHRYEIGFSGDVVPSWASLAFQPYFTSTAANVAYGYWSHDLGGHTQPSPPELFTRWVQWGAFSPIFRTHTTKDPLSDRRLWAYPLENYNAMAPYVRLRAQLIPYIYTSSRQALETGVSLQHPLYYDYPEEEDAYTFSSQYLFGDDLLIAPVVVPLAPETGLAYQDIYLPPGQWVEWDGGQMWTGGKVFANRSFTLDEVPVFARAGAIIPMADVAQSLDEPVDPLHLVIFPGTSQGKTRVYEDDGTTNAYTQGAYTWTHVTYERLHDGQDVHVHIAPAEGSYTGQPTTRSYRIAVRGVYPTESFSVNGQTFDKMCQIGSEDQADSCWSYDGYSLAAVVHVPKQSTADTTDVHIHFSKHTDNTDLLSGIPRVARRAELVKTQIDAIWPTVLEEQKALEDAAETPSAVSFSPHDAAARLATFEKTVHDAATFLSSLHDLDEGTKKRLLAVLGVV